MFFASPLLLVGLAAVLIPPAIHFLSRRRYDEVDWGAMRFLQLTPKSRRKVFVEQWLLMALRMAALGLLALALAGPSIRSTHFNRFDRSAPRTTVLLIDVSASMGVKYDARTTIEGARQWARDFLERMQPGDRVAVFAVKGEVIPLLAIPTPDPDQARAALELLPTPTGSADWPGAIEAAHRILGADGNGEIVVLTDGQRFGWADADAVTRWELLARRLSEEGRRLPPTWVVNIVAGRPAPPQRASITAFTANRTATTTNSEVQFEGTITRAGTTPRLRLTVDGRSAGEVALGPSTAAEVRFSFTRKFLIGSHLVTLALDPDTDTRHLALDVFPPHSVLIVDGDPRPDATTRGSDYLRRALSPANDPSPSFVARMVPISRFAPADLSQGVKVVENAPRVLILSNVEKLSADQSRAVESFAGEGGGVLITLGDRTNAAEWNRNGRGWLPARLLEPSAHVGDPTTAPKPRTSDLDHPAMNLFRKNLPGGLHTAYFPRHWKLKADGGAIMSLTNEDALFAEKAVGRGRVVAAVPLDAGWETNLVRLPDFVPLVHELAHYLAAGGVTPANLSPGESIVFRPRDEPPAAVTVVPPDGLPRAVAVAVWPFRYEATTDSGVYRVTSAGGQVRHFVVRPDPRESDLTPANESDRERVAATLGSVEEVATLDEFLARRGRGPKTWDFGDVVLVLLLGLFAAELRCARRTAGAA